MEIWIELKGDEESKSSCFYTQLALKQREFEWPWATYAGIFFFFFSRKHYITAWTLHQSLDGGDHGCRGILETEGQV